MIVGTLHCEKTDVVSAECAQNIVNVGIFMTQAIQTRSLFLQCLRKFLHLYLDPQRVLNSKLTPFTRMRQAFGSFLIAFLMPSDLESLNSFLQTHL